MLDEQPRLLFTHLWADDDAAKLARRLSGILCQGKLAQC